jgi:hypothetical protein
MNAETSRVDDTGAEFAVAHQFVVRGSDHFKVPLTTRPHQ